MEVNTGPRNRPPVEREEKFGWGEKAPGLDRKEEEKTQDRVGQARPDQIRVVPRR